MRLLLLAAMLVALPAAATPIVIAHRGASGERPEHTLAAYGLAIEQGADFVEPDLVLTKDGVLVCRHENEISGTTDIASRPEFAGRKTSKTIDGREVAGWFTEDLTLAELKTLRARERLPQLRPGNAAHDGRFEVPTFAELLAFVRAREKAVGRKIGVYPETKHPSYFASIGLDFDAPLLAELRRAGYANRRDPVFIQSFEVSNLKRLRGKTKLRLVQLIGEANTGPADLSGLGYDTMLTDNGLRQVARYADGIGPEKTRIVPRDADGRRLPPTDLVARAHKARLTVHVWTVRAENHFLPVDLRRGPDPRAHGNVTAELKQLYAAGVDGVFSDFPRLAVEARR
jgi:glycerophosphoryl diester phosphodiesterase